MRELIIKQGGHLVRRCILTKSTITIGRDRFCDITLRDKTVSKRHAMILFDNKHSYIEDMGSTNATEVNTQPIQQCKLEDKDIIYVGRFQIHFRHYTTAMNKQSAKSESKPESPQPTTQRTESETPTFEPPATKSYIRKNRYQLTKSA